MFFFSCKNTLWGCLSWDGSLLAGLGGFSQQKNDQNGSAFWCWKLFLATRLFFRVVFISSVMPVTQPFTNSRLPLRRSFFLFIRKAFQYVDTIQLGYCSWSLCLCLGFELIHFDLVLLSNFINKPLTFLSIIICYYKWQIIITYVTRVATKVVSAGNFPTSFFHQFLTFSSGSLLKTALS